MKVLLIASFLDAEIREQNIFKEGSAFFYWLIRLFRLPKRVGQLNDHAPWIRGLISFLETQEDVVLHVAGPQIRLKKHLYEYELRGVMYHFYSSEWTSFLRVTERWKLWKRFQLSGYYTRRILKKVNPDIVVLSGTENPVVAVSILYAEKYPRFCLCQTIYNNPERIDYGIPKKINQQIEKEIIRQLRFFGVYSKLHYYLLKSINPSATIFRFNYPSTGELLEPIETTKQYDFVNFALMHGSRKGTTDSILALSIVKKKHPNVTLNIVGGCDVMGLEKLKQLVKNNNLEENVIFTPFYENRSDVLLHVQKSRFAVLPCKLDHVSGTMTQSMQLGLPLVVYRTTGTPTFNREKECVLIAEKGDIEGLASHMRTLMEDPQKAAMLARNAKEYQNRLKLQTMRDGTQLITTFRTIIRSFHFGAQIPQEQLFDEEQDD